MDVAIDSNFPNINGRAPTTPYQVDTNELMPLLTEKLLPHYAKT